MRRSFQVFVAIGIATFLVCGCSGDDGSLTAVDATSGTTDTGLSQDSMTPDTDQAVDTGASDIQAPDAPSPSAEDTGASPADTTTPPPTDAGSAGPKPQDPVGRTGWACETNADCIQEPEHACIFGFCSERCKLVDLSKWLDGTYRVPGEKTTIPDDQPVN